MQSNTRSVQPGGAAVPLKMLVRLPIFFAFLGAVLFVSAGTLNWVMAWVYLGIYMAGSTVGVILLARRNPDLINERAAAPEDAKRWDRILTNVTIPLALLGPPLVAGLDMRFGWTSVGLTVQGVALAGFLLGYAFSFWAGMVNKFYSRVVRIQTDRDHVTVTDGPYRFVRHPGYLGTMGTLAALPLMLGSLWALVPAGLAAVILLARTVMEDHTLHAELAGYREYAARVRYRLLPGIW